MSWLSRQLHSAGKAIGGLFGGGSAPIGRYADGGTTWTPPEVKQTFSAADATPSGPPVTFTPKDQTTFSAPAKLTQTPQSPPPSSANAQTMKLQQTASPYSAGAAGQASLQQGQQPMIQKPISQFSLPSVQGVTFGGS